MSCIEKLRKISFHVVKKGIEQERDTEWERARAKWANCMETKQAWTWPWEWKFAYENVICSFYCLSTALDFSVHSKIHICIGNCSVSIFFCLLSFFSHRIFSPSPFTFFLIPIFRCWFMLITRGERRRNYCRQRQIMRNIRMNIREQKERKVLRASVSVLIRSSSVQFSFSLLLSKAWHGNQ